MKTSHAVARALLLAIIACTASACAIGPAPFFSGARTTPNARGDVFAGSAVRVPLGSLVRASHTAPSTERTLLTLLGREGAIPVASMRYGFGDNADIGVTLASSALTFAGRYTFGVSDTTRIILGLSPSVGRLMSDDASGTYYGITLPAVVSFDLGGVYELWTGARIGLDRATGNVAAESMLAMTGFRVGGVVGLALGFRTIAALIELAADYESWTGATPLTEAKMSGIVLTPAFAIRIRL